MEVPCLRPSLSQMGAPFLHCKGPLMHINGQLSLHTHGISAMILILTLLNFGLQVCTSAARTILKNTDHVLPLEAHMLKLKQYRED